MPPLPPAPSVLRVALSGTQAVGDVWLTRFFLQYTGTAPTPTQLGTFDNAVSTAFSSDLKGHMDIDKTLTQIETIDLSSSTGAVAILPVSVVGTRSGAVNPPQICTVVSYKIARRYRGGHPRGYWPLGGNADLATANEWNTSYTAAVDTDMGTFFNALFASGWTGAGTISHVNVSYFSGFTVVTDPITHRARNVPTLRGTPLIDAVTTVQTRLLIGTQRRREAFID